MLSFLQTLEDDKLHQTSQNISFIGFGEAAQAFALGLKQATPSLAMRAFDVKTVTNQRENMEIQYKQFAVHGEQSTSSACRNADIVFSLVTADQAESAAREAAKEPLHDLLFLDCNSCSPETKRGAARLIEAAGGRYIDVAIMTPVHPNLHQSPCLLAGPEANAALKAIRLLGMKSTIVNQEVGAASVQKMIRSVMIKGMEALTLECFLAARKAGIEKDILSSLETSFANFDWRNRAPYMIERAMTHGKRRAEEMREVSKTLVDLGIAPHMTKGTISRQQEAGAAGLDAEAIGPEDISALTNALLCRDVLDHSRSGEQK